MEKTSYLKKTLLLVTFGTSVLLIASCGNQRRDDTRDVAEEQNQERFDDNEKRQDAQFLVNAAEINLEQIQLGQLAQQKGRTTHVKELGKMMEETHTKSQRELTALAQRKSIAIPTSPTDDIRDAYEDLNETSADDFDKEYSDMMVSRNKDAIDTFENASEDSYDTDIRNWASATLRDLRRNHDQSMDCQRKVGEMAVQNR